jgi:hypothetical protein
VTDTYAFGLDTFGDRNAGADGRPLPHAQTIRNVAEEGVSTHDQLMTNIELYGHKVIPRVRELLSS